MATGPDGKYSLTIPNAPQKFTLVYSFVGMLTQEIVYAGKDTIDVVMKEDVKALEDVVVTGFMNIRNSSFTGNAVTVKKEDLLKVSKTNVIRLCKRSILLSALRRIIVGARILMLYPRCIFVVNQVWV